MAERSAEIEIVEGFPPAQVSAEGLLAAAKVAVGKLVQAEDIDERAFQLESIASEEDKQQMFDKSGRLVHDALKIGAVLDMVAPLGDSRHWGDVIHKMALLEFVERTPQDPSVEI